LVEFANLVEVETFVHQYQIEIDARNKEMLDKLEKIHSRKRWKFWIDELAPCFKCYACRAPAQCAIVQGVLLILTSRSGIPVASTELGNLEWHFDEGYPSDRPLHRL